MKVQVKDITFAYPSGVRALQQVSLDIESGESVAILGENGAGKTTLAKHFNGLLQPDEGQVWVGDWSTADHTPAEMARRISYVFQNPDDQLFARSAHAEVAFGPSNLGLSGEALQQRVETALAQVGLLDAADRHPYDLHASERKLLSLAAVLAMHTQVVVVDEPTTGQDHHGVQTLGGVMQELKSAGRTLIVISHDVDFCAEHFDRAVLMADGSIIGDGPIEHTLSDAELVRRAAVELPQLVRLARGLHLPGAPRSPQAFADLYHQHHRAPGGGE